MKSLLASIFIVPLTGFSQPTMQFNSVINQDQPTLFVGVYNSITIKDAVNNSRLTASHGTVTKGQDNTYIIQVTSAMPDTITLFEGQKISKQMIVPVEVIPPPIAKPATIRDSTASIKQLLLNPFLGVEFPGSNNYKGNLIVTSFVVVIVQQNTTDVQSFKIQGNVFSDALKNAIETLQPGDKLEFNDINAAYQNTWPGKKLPSLVIYVK